MNFIAEGNFSEYSLNFGKNGLYIVAVLRLTRTSMTVEMLEMYISLEISNIMITLKCVELFYLPLFKLRFIFSNKIKVVFITVS